MNFFHHPYVNGDVAKYLVDNGVRFIGIDTINTDQTGGTEFPVHDLFSEKKIDDRRKTGHFLIRSILNVRMLSHCR